MNTRRAIFSLSKTRFDRLATAWLALTGALVVVPAASVYATDTVVVKLRARAEIRSSDPVRIRDVANVTGGTLGERRQIGDLDIASAQEVAAGREIGRRRVYYRVRLAGWPDEKFQMVGAEACHLTDGGKRLSDQTVAEVIAGELSALWSIDRQMIDVRFTSPLDIRVPSAAVGRVEVRPIVPPEFYPGNQRLKVGVYHDGDLTETFVVDAAIRVRRRVARTVRSIARGATIGPTDVSIREESLYGKQALAVDEDPVGKMALTTLAANRIIEMKHVGSAAGSGADQAPIQVRRGTSVRLVAKKAGLNVTLPGATLMKTARVGDYVDVKNPTSDRIVRGRLVARDLVHVDF